MISLLLGLLLQAAPPVIDPILEPRRGPRGSVDPGTPATIPQPRAAPSPEMARLSACARTAQSDPQGAIAEGARWLIEGASVEAEQCVGLGYAASGDWTQAGAAFGRALDAVPVGDPRRPVLLAQQANASLAGGDPGAARTALDMMLATPDLPAQVRGEALLDRARAFVALDDGPSAQADLTEAQGLIPDDRLVWLLSATLARRQGEVDAAGDLIDRALEIDQEDAAVLLEAGNIAIELNAYEVAREAWDRALIADSEGEAGQAASRSLARLDEYIAEGAAQGADAADAPAEDDAPADNDPGE